MKANILNAFYSIILLSACTPRLQDLPVNSCKLPTEMMNTSFSKAVKIQTAVEQLVKEGVPGCAMAVYSKEGWWGTAAGLAKIEEKLPMQACHVQYLQSISKTYMSVAVLKLYEQGKINLDAPITNYLPAKYSRYITDAEKITVRMLLNHTSGIPEYNFSPAYVSYLLQHPNHYFSPEDYLGYIEDKPLDFTPGDKYAYRNTNYVILALMTDAITGNHSQFIAEHIFIPLSLTQTFYRNQPGYLNYPHLVNTYWDRYSNSIVENVSQMQRTNVSSLIGDDGIVASPVDAVKFLKGLMEGKLLSPSTLELMQTWVKNRKGEPAYGLGLSYATVQGKVAYGHTGGGLGAGCELFYFPEKNIYVFIAINLGTVTDSPLHKGAVKALDNIFEALLE